MSEETENKTDPRFYAIAEAAYSDREEAARLLAEDATLITIKNSIGETAFHYLVVEDDLEGTAWFLAQGSEVNTQNDFGDTPLLEAATLGYLEMCRFLLDSGADISIKDDTDATAISEAAYNGHRGVLELLLMHLPPDADINEYVDRDKAEMIFEKCRIIDILKARGLQVDE